MKVLDLFSGIGCGSEGLEAAGMKVVAHCEQDADCRKVIHKYWPDVPCYEDVRELTKEKLDHDGITNIDVLIAGFPCQPYSRGNWKRKGRGDSRDLSGEVVRLVQELEPTVFIGENTEGFIDIGYDAFVDDLEEIGYFCESFNLPSCAFGLPSLERHIWVIASRCSQQLQRIAETTIQNIEDLQEQLSRGNPGVGERWHLPESRVLRSGEGSYTRADANRVKQIGNAFPPIAAKIIGKAIMATTNPGG